MIVGLAAIGWSRSAIADDLPAIAERVERAWRREILAGERAAEHPVARVGAGGVVVRGLARAEGDSLYGGARAAEARGQVTVLYWWASWCPFCAVQSPHIEKLWRKERTRGLQVLALSIDRTREAAAAYLQQKGYTFPAAMLTPEVAKVLPKPKGLPVVVVRGRDGKVAFAEAGEMFPEDIEGLAKFL